MKRSPIMRTLWITSYGQVEVTDDDFRAAGITTKFLPRWTSTHGYDGTGMLSMGPDKNSAILRDFLDYFTRDEARRVR